MAGEISVHVFWRESKGRFYMYAEVPGEPRQQRSTKTADEAEANKIAGAWEAELREGRYSKTSRMGWGEFRELFFEQHVEEQAERTACSYATAFNSFEKHAKPLRLADATTPRLASYKTTLRGAKVSPATVANYLRHLKAAFNWAHDQGYLPAVPECKPPKGAKTKKMKGRPVTLEEFDRMVAAVPRVTPAAKVEDYRFYLRALMHSGLRLDESLGVTWDESVDAISFDLAGGWIRIPADVEKGKKNRLLPMTQELIDVLSTVPPERRHGRVFSVDGYDTVSKRLTAIGKAAGVLVSGKKGASAQDLRRSFGTRLSRRLSTLDLKAMMRHESVQTTQDYYVDQEAEQLAASVRGAVAPLVAPGPTRPKPAKPESTQVVKPR